MSAAETYPNLADPGLGCWDDERHAALAEIDALRAEVEALRQQAAIGVAAISWHVAPKNITEMRKARREFERLYDAFAAGRVAAGVAEPGPPPVSIEVEEPPECPDCEGRGETNGPEWEDWDRQITGRCPRCKGTGLMYPRGVAEPGETPPRFKGATSPCCLCGCTTGTAWAEDGQFPQCDNCAHVCSHNRNTDDARSQPFHWAAARVAEEGTEK